MTVDATMKINAAKGLLRMMAKATDRVPVLKEAERAIRRIDWAEPEKLHYAVCSAYMELDGLRVMLHSADCDDEADALQGIVLLLHDACSHMTRGMSFEKLTGMKTAVVRG